MRLFAAAAALLVLFGVAFQPKASAAQEMIDPETIPCVACHNETTLIVSKQAQFHHSPHGSGESYIRGTNGNCAGCHGSEAAEARIEAHLPPHAPSIKGVVNVSPINCRTCHDIHDSYTLEDFSLVGDAAPVQLEMTGTLFDGGAGNLCANCHQIRNELPMSSNGEVTIETTRFGPHHGVEAQMLLGEGGLGVTSAPNTHLRKVEDTCVDCHMGPVGEKDPADPLPAVARNHTFEAEVSYCAACHTGMASFNQEGVQTEIQELLDEVRPLLIAKGIMDDREGRENRSIEGTYPEEVAYAMWNYMVVLEDGSRGMHHPDWARKLLKYARDVLSEP